MERVSSISVFYELELESPMTNEVHKTLLLSNKFTSYLVKRVSIKL